MKSQPDANVTPNNSFNCMINHTKFEMFAIALGGNGALIETSLFAKCH